MVKKEKEEELQEVVDVVVRGDKEEEVEEIVEEVEEEVVVVDEDSESFLDMWFEGIEPDYLTEMLPEKLLVRCFGYLTDIVDVCCLERVCKKTLRLIRHDKTLWEYLLRSHYYQEWMKMKQGELLYGSNNATNPMLSVSQKRYVHSRSVPS